VTGLAARIYGTQRFTAADTHTIQFKITGGVTYIPIPTATGANFAGLFTIDLPLGIVAGQEFDCVIRRVTLKQPILLYTPRIITNSLPAKKYLGVKVQPGQAGARIQQPTGSWRYVLGSFEVKIPVTTKAVMLPPEETTLAILKWRLGQMSNTNRWYPVMKRYIGYIADRISGLGGDPSAIQPSLQGSSTQPGSEISKNLHEYLGKVNALIYDRFGDFEGFVLDTETGNMRFAGREPEIERLARCAWAERILIGVFVEKHASHSPKQIVLYCPPMPVKA